MTQYEDVLIFNLGRQHYGITVSQLSEIIQMVALTELPDLPEGILGIINYRGEIAPLMDLRQILKMPAQNIHLNSLIVVVKGASGKIGLLVDGVEGVNTLPFELESVDNPYISGILRLQDDLVLMVDVAALEKLTT